MLYQVNELTTDGRLLAGTWQANYTHHDGSLVRADGETVRSFREGEVLRVVPAGGDSPVYYVDHEGNATTRLPWRDEADLNELRRLASTGPAGMAEARHRERLDGRPWVRSVRTQVQQVLA